MAVIQGQLQEETVRKSDRRGLKSVEEHSSGLCEQKILRLSKDDLLCSPQLHLHLKRHRVSLRDIGGGWGGLSTHCFKKKADAKEGSNNDFNSILR